MTYEEAQIIIGNIPIKPEVLDDCYSIAEYQEAKAMAIKALEQQPSLKDRLEKEYLVESLKEDLQKLYAENEELHKKLEQHPYDDCISREELKKLICQNNDKYGYSDRFHEFVEKCLQLPSVTLKAEWIPCSERLPDTDDKVLCWYEYYHWSRKKVLPEYGIGGYLRETSAWFGEVANGKDVRVIAWMPLPQHYSESEE